ncbi:hypothetical protein A7P53_06850 [Acinetobacter defluvii]|uniref:hypothetical protein n=1 Tax=Acinetobacter defluvii TaxID=1871111 RepID=UPI00148FCC63|nr:hypothetical protein [Acinetobacter defluvii]NNP72184.1 hypothetical protein [Acinetobacter defluvii]
MNFRELVIKDHPNITTEQLQTFEAEFIALNNEWTMADIESINSQEYQHKLCEKFDQSMVKLGYGDFDPDAIAHVIEALYSTSEYESLMEYIIISYRNGSGGEGLDELYMLMLSKLQNDFDE